MNVKKPHIQKIPKKSEIDNLVSLNNKKDYESTKSGSMLYLHLLFKQRIALIFTSTQL